METLIRTTPEVYAAINRVTATLSTIGISKNRQTTGGSTFKYRGIDDVINTLSPILAAEGLCVLPRILNCNTVERTSKSGGQLFYTTVEAEFDFVSAKDGSMHTCRTFGEAMDSSDKSTNKAMSAAYKYVAFQAFAIPVEGTPDADEIVHEVAAEVVKITLQQSTEVMALLNSFEMTAVEFCKVGGVRSINELPAANLSKSLAWIEKIGAKRQGVTA